MSEHERVYTRPFVLMGLANLFTVSSFGSFYLFPLFLTHRGGSKADIGIMMGAFALSAVLCRPWISEMIDRIGRKRSYTFGCCIMTALPFSYLLFQGQIHEFYFSLILVRLIHGVGLAICFTAVFTYIADIVPGARLNEGIGMFGVTGLAGLAIGPVIAEAIINHFGFTAFFVSASLLAAFGLLIQLPLPESHSRSSNAAPASFFSLLRQSKILAVASLAFLFGFGLAASGGFVSPYGKEQHIAFVSIYYLGYSFSAVTTRLAGGKLADRVGERRVIPYALAITGLGLIMLLFLGGIPILVLSGIMTGCGHGLLFPCLNSLMIRGRAIHIRGKLTGVFTGALDAGSFLGSVILGYIGEEIGYSGLFLAAGLAVLGGLVISWRGLQGMEHQEI
ncbi:MAG: MFS transporter [Deltaproteobacteria bacterium]|nr:MFS transporter [Deltaproteobacteria bacterium]